MSKKITAEETDNSNTNARNLRSSALSTANLNKDSNQNGNVSDNETIASKSQANLPPEDHNLNYYQEYCRLFIANIVLTTQMKELVSEKNELLAKLSKLEVNQLKSLNKLNYKKKSEELALCQLGDDDESKKKRFRRNANEIERNYKCSVLSCQKVYGSEGSLAQHMKLKHPEVSYISKQQTQTFDNASSLNQSISN